MTGSAIIVSTSASALTVAPGLILLSARAGRLSRDRAREYLLRWLTWVAIATAFIVTIHVGAAAFTAFVAVGALLAFAEFARATGLFREHGVSLATAAGIVTLIVAMSWGDRPDGVLPAVAALGVCAIAGTTLLRDDPRGYLQRVSLATLGFALFGVCFGHLALYTTLPDFAPTVQIVVFLTALNDIFACLCGRAIGGPALAPRTSPGKTLGGAVGALVLTMAVAVVLGRLVWSVEAPGVVTLLVLGLVVSLCGQVGDLVLSSIKRDIGLKDFSAALPGHGGILDRADSLIVVAPVAYHVIVWGVL